jgi:hypothetical protein
MSHHGTEAMQNSVEGSYDLYQKAREHYGPTPEQEARIWATLTGAPNRECDVVISELLWVALTYSTLLSSGDTRDPRADATEIRNAAAKVEKAGQALLSKLRVLDEAQRSLEAGSLYSVFVLRGEAKIDCIPARQTIESLVIQARGLQECIGSQSTGRYSEPYDYWFVERLVHVWERVTGCGATRYKDSRVGTFAMIREVAAVTGLNIAEGQIDYFLRKVLSELKKRSA